MRNGNQNQTLQETLVQDVEKLVCLEKAFMMSLPMMAQSASHVEVQQEFERLTAQTREQIARLQSLLPSPVSPSQEHIEDGGTYNGAHQALVDCKLIADVRQKQHAKIALYSTACLWAHQMGLKEIEQTLNQNLKEEETDCEKLLHLAQQVGCAIA